MTNRSAQQSIDPMNDSDSIDEELERGYNVRAPRTDYDEVVQHWTTRSESFRAGAGGRLDVAYGPAERHRLDIFSAGAGAPVLVYLHGGYWQRGDKSIYSFVAEPFLRTNVSFVLLNYTLCPQTSVPDITDEVRSALAWLHRNGSRFDLDPDRINVTGHSAGGHLTAMMLATDWNGCGDDLPGDLVKSGIPISGLYDLEPLRRTSINHAAQIDDAAARDCSPLLGKPRAGAPVLVVVGGTETDAFHAQADEFVRRWAGLGARMEQYVEPGVDHFDVVNRLADPASGLFRKTLDWLV